MSDAGFDPLIEQLAANLRPVGRLPPPWRRTAAWLALAAALAAGLIFMLAMTGGLHALGRRLALAPDLRLALAGSTLTALLAGYAAFQTSIPGRSRRWPLLPLPALALWLAASGIGCLRGWQLPGTEPATLEAERGCLLLIIALSLPLSIVILAMLRRGFAVRPGLTATLGGLAAAAASASLLALIHPLQAAVSDLLVHGFAVGAVVVASHALGGNLLHRR